MSQQINVFVRTPRASRGLGGLIVAAGCAGMLISGAAAGAGTVDFVGWGGSIATAQKSAFFKPFERATGDKVTVLDYNGGLAQVRAQVQSKNVTWDVIDSVPADVARGCDEGLFEPIDPASLPPAPGGTPAVKDYMPGTLTRCGAGVDVWANVFAYDPKSFPNGGPKTIADVFDLKRFPGKRGLNKAPQANLEWALMADGVPPDQVYKVLGTEAGIARAFSMLDRLKGHVVWWQTGAQPPQLLADGEVSISSAYNGRIYNAVKKEGQHFVTIWDGQVWDYAPVAILKGTRHKAAAMKLVAFMSRPEIMARLTQHISYGPVRRSAMKYVAPAMKPNLGNSPEHMATALQSDTEFWANHADELVDRFNTWLAK